jgi:hypothetical protein
MVTTGVRADLGILDATRLVRQLTRVIRKRRMRESFLNENRRNS